MFAIGNLFIALANILNVVLTVLYWLILIRALVSWVNPDPYNPIVQFLYRMTEPVLYPLRRVLPLMGGIDFSPIVAFLAIIFLKSFLVATLLEFGYRMR
jgi:YggT family protein